MNKPALLQLNPRDNTAVALRPLCAGETVLAGEIQITLTCDIPQAHKVALQDIARGEDVIKYGAPIGHATQAVLAGGHLHVHNLKTNLSGELEYTYQPELHPVRYEKRGLTFQGYRRANGAAGIRNDLYILPTVGCVNGTAEQMQRAYEVKYGPLDSVFDNVIVLKHPFGCSQLGDDHKSTRRILADAALHPNAGGVLLVGLGCENNTMTQLLEEMGSYDEARIKWLVVQEVTDEIEAGAALLHELAQAAQNDRREPVPVSELSIGLKCGGSDGLSGITANPLLGALSDLMIAQGGSAVLTEVPEMFGAEQVLMARARDEAVFGKTVELINGFKAYFAAHNEPVYENPSPGNKAGGITTLEDKSLGCTQKSGTSEVVDVLSYGERLKEKGLSLLQAPGNDLVAASALACSGCQLVLFSTGRGTPFGAFVPTMKVSTNSQLYEKKPHWMDFNAGRLLEEPMEMVLEDFLLAVLAVASGKSTRNEENKFSEISIFKTGVTL